MLFCNQYDFYLFIYESMPKSHHNETIRIMNVPEAGFQIFMLYGKKKDGLNRLLKKNMIQTVQF